ncbi:glucose-6-phosphate isomerase [Aquimarina sp. TRL1]|uniref:glucose-6-phosphate isomerase n=1 Tax=Aquimarina sp. (strain TRL1) TaxID=2736252 RepID=UPI00158C0E13|nr:glucose-6-phosphate isomerase [Aquimarina sp. TRL1]QKX04559.1 glucose-6-phosphate isomerase [Aquimarina sp. TRL1]
MSLASIDPTKTSAWKALQKHLDNIKDTHLTTFFKENKNRANELSIKWNDFFVDYSKNRIDATTKKLLLQLAEETKLKEAINLYFSGAPINQTEKRAVLHTALRTPANKTIHVDGKNITQEIKKVKSQIKEFTEAIISGKNTGYSGKAFTDIVNIGIGGSDLGPHMITEALAFYQNHLTSHFISNVDGDHVQQTLKKLNPETTLFVVVSKTFSTQETLTNAQTCKEWFLQKSSTKDISHHFVAVSCNTENTTSFGINQHYIFPMWDWVGGRFSLWSSAGLSISLSIGYHHFNTLLEGAFEMDTHFKESPFDENIPVILALISIWYNNFFEAETEAIIPYSQYLHKLPAYLQQAFMESNGKSIDRDGNPISYQTGSIIWGATGTNAQHAFFQLIHQGTKLIPTEFIAFKESLFQEEKHQDKLIANFFAQTEALMNGKSTEEVSSELNTTTLPEEQIAKLIPYKIFKGNKPSTSILINKLTPKSIGALVSLYEHRIFAQGIIWNIYSYDQWGVELGKQLAIRIEQEINTKTVNKHDQSTTNLLTEYIN